jgi:hypothetical protein
MPKRQEGFPNSASLRNAAAGLIKSFIRARARQEPGFLDSNDFKRWGITDLKTESRTTATLLRLARKLHDNFERRLLEGLDSIPEPTSGTKAEATDALIEIVCRFVHGDVGQAIKDAERGKNVQWNKLLAWQELPELREALDLLPSTPPCMGINSEMPVVKITPQTATIEWKDTRYTVSHGTASAFEAMIEAKGQPVGIGKYVRKPGEWLKKLRKTHPALGAIVAQAGKKGCRLTVFDPAPNSA